MIGGWFSLGEGLSHSDAIQWGKIENAERTDEVASLPLWPQHVDAD
jgi:hypothetical protein